jgi:hypothetical protein
MGFFRTELHAKSRSLNQAMKKSQTCKLLLIPSHSCGEKLSYLFPYRLRGSQLMDLIKCLRFKRSLKLMYKNINIKMLDINLRRVRRILSHWTKI